MRLLFAAALLSCAVPALAQDGGRPPRRACSPDETFAFWFDKAHLEKVAESVAGAICKPIVIGPGAEKIPLSLTGGKDIKYTGEQMFKAFVAAAELGGCTVVEKDGVIRVTLAKK